MLQSNRLKNLCSWVWGVLESQMEHDRVLAYNKMSQGIICGIILSLLAFASVSAQPYTISGKVVNTAGDPVSGVTINLTGDVTFSNTTKADGTYKFPYLYIGKYTISPYHSSYIFNPTSVTFDSLISDTTQNFTAVSLYYIRGYVKDGTGAGIKDVTVNLTGDTTYSYITGTDGYYKFSRILSGNYEITPAKGGWDFDPVKITFSPLIENVTDQNFTGTHFFMTIKGRVTRKDDPGIGMSGVILKLTGPITETGAAIKEYITTNDGYYEFSPLLSGNFELTPSKSGWSFDPPTVIFSPLIDRTTIMNISGEPSAPIGEIKIIGGEEGYVNPAKNEVAKILLNPVTSGAVEIKIYTLRGDLVWEKTETLSVGEKRIAEWNCKNKDGEEVVAGIYLVYVKGAGIEAKKKVAVLK